MTLGTGIAIAAIWASVAVIAWVSPGLGVLAVCGAIWVTLGVVGKQP